MIREIEKIINENGPRWETPFFPPRSLFFIKTSRIKKNVSGKPAVFLAFDQRGSSPRWVVKGSRDPESASALQKEYTHLLHFYHTLSSDFHKTIPRPLLSREDNGQFLYIEGGLGGALPSGRVHLDGSGRHQREIEKILHHAAAWLSRFQKETRNGVVEIDEKWIKKEVESAIAHYVLRYTASRLEENFFQGLLEGWNSLIGLRLPSVGCHGRFSHENILLGNDAISVFDWSSSKKAGLPYEDLFFFACSLRVLPKKGEQDHPLVSFEKCFFDSNWLDLKIKEWIAGFFGHHHLNPSLFNQFFPLFLIKRAIAEEQNDYAHPLGHLVWKDRLSFYITHQERILQVKNPEDDRPRRSAQPLLNKAA